MCRVYLWIAFFLRRLTHSVRSLSFNSDHKPFFSSAFECATSLPLPSGLFSFIKFYARERESFCCIFYFFSCYYRNVFFIRWMDIGHGLSFILWYVMCALCFIHVGFYIYGAWHTLAMRQFSFFPSHFFCARFLYVCVCVCEWVSVYSLPFVIVARWTRVFFVCAVDRFVICDHCQKEKCQ